MLPKSYRDDPGIRSNRIAQRINARFEMLKSFP